MQRTPSPLVRARWSLCVQDPLVICVVTNKENIVDHLCAGCLLPSIGFFWTKMEIYIFQFFL